MSSDATRYTPTPEVLAAHLEGEAVLLHMETKDYFRLNDTAAAVWKGLERGLDRGALLGELCERFEVDGDTAARELDRLLDELLARRLISTAA